MTRRTITGCDAVHPDRRGGQHAGVCTGVLVIDDEAGIGVMVNNERSRMKQIAKANELLDEIIDKITKGGA